MRRWVWVMLALSACAPAEPLVAARGEAPPPVLGAVTAEPGGTPTLPEGYATAPEAKGLVDPRAVAVGPDGRPYVVEGVPARLTRIEPDGSATPIATGGGNGPWTGAAHVGGSWFVAEMGGPLGGRILRVDPGGGLRPVVAKLPPETEITLAPGRDGWLYAGVASPTNAGVAGPGAPRDIPCQDVEARAGGPARKGRVPCTGSILRIAPASGTVELVAWGFRRPTGLDFAPDGRLMVAENSYRPDPVRQIAAEPDLLWEVTPGVWYGFPDFHGQLALADPLLADYPNPPPAPAATLAGDVHGLAVARDPAFGPPGEAFVAVQGELGAGRVEFASPRTGESVPFAADLREPTAVAFSADGGTLWVADAGTGTLWRVMPVGGR